MIGHRRCHLLTVVQYTLIDRKFTQYTVKVSQQHQVQQQLTTRSRGVNHCPLGVTIMQCVWYVVRYEHVHGVRVLHWSLSELNCSLRSQHEFLLHLIRPTVGCKRLLLQHIQRLTGQGRKIKAETEKKAVAHSGKYLFLLEICSVFELIFFWGFGFTPSYCRWLLPHCQKHNLKWVPLWFCPCWMFSNQLFSFFLLCHSKRWQ